MTRIDPTLRYSTDHEWITDGSPATIGISQIAADALGEVVYIDLPAVGDRITAGEAFGEVESTKSVSELFAPVTGEVVEVNEALVDEPGALNADAYAAWIIRVTVDEEGPLLSAEEYAAEQGEQ